MFYQLVEETFSYRSEAKNTRWLSITGHVSTPCNINQHSFTYHLIITVNRMFKETATPPLLTFTSSLCQDLSSEGHHLRWTHTPPLCYVSIKDLKELRPSLFLTWERLTSPRQTTTPTRLVSPQERRPPLSIPYEDNIEGRNTFLVLLSLLISAAQYGPDNMSSTRQI